MTLLASLNVASELAFGMRERKAGRDPSTDELEEILMPVLREELDTLNLLFFQLQSSLALSEKSAVSDTEDDTLHATEPVHRFIDLVRLQKGSLALHRVHQRLLSLYPAVDEHTAEKARQLKNRCEALADIEADAFTIELDKFLKEARPFIRSLVQIIG